MNIVRVDESSDLLADYRNLTDVALRRRLEPENGLYMAESAKVLDRALAAGHAPRSVMTAERWLGDVERILTAHARDDAPVYVVPDAVAEQVTGYTVHRGMLAAMNRPADRPVAEVLESARLVLVLEDIVDHTNVGAAFRAAAGLGADAVLVAPRCADPLYRRSVRVSMGTVFQVPWTRLPEWRAVSGDGAADLLHAAGFEIAALALADGAVGLDDYADAPPERCALVMGSEGDGLSRRALEAADRVVTIPMAGGVDSLNVASAAAVALWAVGRGQRA
ncbi:TrmH family RNA methyltransferase [Microbacterium halophytorum]|uniref:TrmH family RNA methyltransferase n=1 Tax=Microbacterium halophytorum TaxID=2067568 RepID=UPI000CFD0F41|nr:RNA methyltransferase [Microbacterium halophytorum]